MGNLISPSSSAPLNANQGLQTSQDSSSERDRSLRQTLIEFLNAVDYSFTRYPPFEDLELAVRNEVLSFGTDLRPGWETIVHTTSTLAAMAYAKHPIEIQFSVATITWIAVTIDEFANKDDRVALAGFQQHYLKGQPQGDPLFDHFVAHLHKLWEWYHPVGANAGVAAMINFVTGCCLENMTEEMKVNPAAAHYPDYVREKTGIAEFYAFTNWPAAQFPDIKGYIQAVPAVCRFMNIVNDILSFYKEELAGETVTYVHLLRAVRHKENALVIVGDFIEEAVGLSKEIDTLLSGDAKEMWEHWKIGYITYHLCDSRYKLAELSLFEGKDHTSTVVE